MLSAINVGANCVRPDFHLEYGETVEREKFPYCRKPAPLLTLIVMLLCRTKLRANTVRPYEFVCDHTVQADQTIKQFKQFKHFKQIKQFKQFKQIKRSNSSNSSSSSVNSHYQCNSGSNSSKARVTYHIYICRKM